MGTPPKQRKKYSKPKHPWRIERIEEESELEKTYGLKNKKEIWKTKSMLRGFRGQARRLLAETSEEAEKEKKDLLAKLKRMGVVDSDNLDDVLAVKETDILNRRLQTIVYKKGYANTIKHARQLICHKHVKVGDHKVNVPSYLVPKAQEEQVALDEAYSKSVTK